MSATVKQLIEAALLGAILAFLIFTIIPIRARIDAFFLEFSEHKENMGV